MVVSRVVLGALLGALVLHGGCSDDDDESNGSGAATGTGGSGGGSPGCSSLDQIACDDDLDCKWIGAGCHGDTFFAGCFDHDYFPGQPPCADLPCPDYDTEQACTEQDACNWWPLDCPGQTITDQCLNIAYGDPTSQCSPE
ncbi:MAG: hypothetical protein DRI90_10875 [Deltaproteobacteria bacterium]|nr:MAG: hypothetical protein DRI90_10875 [Deltaproteobacteria bacterium]